MSFFQYLFVRTALLYLLYTAFTGTAFYVWPGLVAYFKTTHVHAGLVGFFLCLVMGVAFWMMPRPRQIRQERLEGAAYVLLNAGLALRLLLEPWVLYSSNWGWRPGLVFAGMLQMLAVGVFAWAMSRRVVTKEYLFHLAKERSEKLNH